MVSYKGTQFVAYYDKDVYVVLGKQKIDACHWETKRTPYRENTSDANNTIGIMVDGDSYLHISWDHHNNELHYCKSIRPGPLELSEKIARDRLK